MTGEAHPTRAAVATAVSEALDSEVGAVDPFAEGMNAVYRVALPDRDVVAKVGTAQRGPRLRSGPLLARRLAAETTVPVPEMLATVPASESPLDRAFYVMEHVEGRGTTDALDLSPTAHERLAREAGRHLASLHDLGIDAPFGRLEARDGELVVERPFGDWPTALRAELSYDPGDVNDRFTDLVPTVADALDPLPATDRGVDRSILDRDYHPKNLVFGPDDADPVVRAVLDFNFRPVGDAPLDVAVAETHLVDVPLGGTDRADRLRAALRGAYVDARGGTTDDHFGPRYPAYRLAATLDVCRHWSYFRQFAREDDPAAAADRLRSFVRSRAAEARVDGA